MPFAVKLGDRQIRLDDLPVATFEKIAAAHDISWVDLLYSPALKPTAWFDLVEAAAKKLGVDCPAKPDTVAEFRALYNDTIERVTDDMPTDFAEGGIPKTDEPATT